MVLCLHFLDDVGFGLGDLLKPDLIMPLLETLPLEQSLVSYLPEVYTSLVFDPL